MFETHSKSKIKKPESNRIQVLSLGEKIRTSGLLNPIQARYQTAPHPVNANYYITTRSLRQYLFEEKMREICCSARILARGLYPRAPERYRAPVVRVARHQRIALDVQRGVGEFGRLAG